MQQKLRFSIWLTIIILTAFAVGYWVWTESFRDENIEYRMWNLGKRANGVEGWKTYRNEEYGFEVKYPNPWFIFSPGGGQLGEECIIDPSDEPIIELSRRRLEDCGFVGESLPSNDAEITVWVTKAWTDIFTILEPPVERIIVAGETAVLYRFSYQQGRPNINASRIYLNHRDKGYLIFLKNQNSDGTSYDSVYDQFLSTFKFIDIVDTSIWKTYRNEEYGFEVKYPLAIGEPNSDGSIIEFSNAPFFYLSFASGPEAKNHPSNKKSDCGSLENSFLYCQYIETSGGWVFVTEGSLLDEPFTLVAKTNPLPKSKDSNYATFLEFHLNLPELDEMPYKERIILEKTTITPSARIKIDQFQQIISTFRFIN